MHLEPPQLILALGFWPAVPLTGYWLLRAAHRAIATSGWLGTVGLSSALGIAVWSPALLLLVALKVYDPEFVGLIGWLVIGGFVVSRLRFQGRPHDLRSRLGELDGWDLVLAVGLMLAAGLYLGFPGEFVLGGRDENSYTLHAVWIAEHRRLDIPYPWPSELHSTFYDAYLRWSGTFRTEPSMTPAFGHVLPVWLAQALTTFGFEGMLRLNGVFSVISIAVVYGLCRSVISKPFAVVTALVLALNPAQIWISRTPLTEVLAQLLLWAAIWLVLTAIRRRTPVPARLAGYVLGAAVLVRIDMLLIVPFMVMAHLGTTLIEDEDSSSAPIWSALYSTGIPSVLIASGYYIAFSRPYVLELMPQLVQIAAIVGVAVLLLYVGTRLSVRDRVAPIVTSRAFVAAVGLGLAGLTIYAWLIRPIHEPFRFFGESQVGLAGTADIRRGFAAESRRLPLCTGGHRRHRRVVRHPLERDSLALGVVDAAAADSRWILAPVPVESSGHSGPLLGDPTVRAGRDPRIRRLRRTRRMARASMASARLVDRSLPRQSHPVRHLQLPGVSPVPVRGGAQRVSDPAGRACSRVARIRTRGGPQSLALAELARLQLRQAGHQSHPLFG